MITKDGYEPRWCASNECEHPDCHRCNPVEGCTQHEKCQEPGRYDEPCCTQHGRGDP